MILLEKLFFLRTVNIFKKVKDDMLIDIASNTIMEKVPANQTIYKKGEMGDCLYIIVSGQIAMLDADDKTLKTLGSKQIFGELAVLSPEKRLISVMTLEECVLLKLKREPLIESIGMDVNFAMAIIEELCQRIRYISKQFLALGEEKNMDSALE